MLVVAVIGILAALVLPKVRIDNSQVDTAARTLSMSLMVAQRDAASRQHNVLLVFDTSASTITTVWDKNNNGAIDPGEKTRPFPWPDHVVLGRPSSVSALGTASARVPSLATTSQGKPMLILQRNGSVDRAVTLYITSKASMKGNAPEARAVIIARATARPEWYAWTGSRWRHAK
jgi:type II secretory pathway pseudopilin PulG